MTHTNPIFHELKVLKFADIYKYNLGLYMHRNLDKFTNIRQHNFNTRSEGEYIPTFQRLTLTQNQSIKFQAPSNWNNIPNDIKNIQTTNSFKRNYKNFLISSYGIL